MHHPSRPGVIDGCNTAEGRAIRTDTSPDRLQRRIAGQERGVGEDQRGSEGANDNLEHKIKSLQVPVTNPLASSGGLGVGLAVSMAGTAVQTALASATGVVRRDHGIYSEPDPSCAVDHWPFPFAGLHRSCGDLGEAHRQLLVPPTMVTVARQSHARSGFPKMVWRGGPSAESSLNRPHTLSPKCWVVLKTTRTLPPRCEEDFQCSINMAQC